MHNCVLRRLLLGVLLPLAGNAQLYLITGITETEFPMTLAEVTVGGTVRQVKELVPQWFTPGIHWPMMTVAWFSISNNLRRAVILQTTLRDRSWFSILIVPP